MVMNTLGILTLLLNVNTPFITRQLLRVATSAKDSRVRVRTHTSLRLRVCARSVRSNARSSQRLPIGIKGGKAARKHKEPTLHSFGVLELPVPKVINPLNMASSGIDRKEIKVKTKFCTKSK